MPRFFIRSQRQPKDERKFKVYTPYWIDPYWFINGTSIEKMVMAELVRRNIYFIFRSQSNTIGGFVDPTWEADFLLPHHKIWIEVQGSYFHSLPGQIENDSLRYAALEMAGWTPVFLWEFDIRTRIIDLFDEYPALRAARIEAERTARDRYGTSLDLPFLLGDPDLSDQLVGLRASNAKRTKPPQYITRRRKRRRPKV